MKQLLKVKVGSHAFGTNIETSDEDYISFTTPKYKETEPVNQ